MTQQQFEYLYKTALMVVDEWDNYTEIQFPAFPGTLQRVVEALQATFEATPGRDHSEPFRPTYLHVHDLLVPLFLASHDPEEFFLVDRLTGGVN
jgi:hypothetical protein